MDTKKSKTDPNSEKVKALLTKAEEGIRDFLDGDKYKKYLQTMSQFHNYSSRNCLLIAMQRPDATLVAGYQAWQKKFKRQVRRGERGIQIVGVTTKKVELPQERKDSDGNPVFDENGEKIIDKITKKYINFVPTYVWDVSQTDGEPLPELDTELSGIVNGYASLMAAIKEVSEYEISFQEIDGSAKGYCSHASKQIVIQKDMPEAQTVKTAIHELAHSIMHDPNSKLDRATKEVQAESVAFVVCEHYGIDTSDYSFPYLATWSSTAELKELQSSMDAIQRAANTLIEKIDKRFAELQIRELDQPALENEQDLTEGEGYKIFYGGPGGQDKEAHDFQKETGWKMVWGSESDGLNGDTYIVYRSIDDVPAPLQKTVQHLDDVFYGNREDLPAADQPEYTIPSVGDHYEYVGRTFEVIDIADSLVYLQSVNDDTHHEIDLQKFVQHPELYTPIPQDTPDQPQPTHVVNTPLYREMANYAYEAGEMEIYRASMSANIACKEAIESALAAHYNVDRWSLDTEAAVSEVASKFSAERIQYVLANTIQHKEHDGRISAKNKEWAAGIEVCSENATSFIVDASNPGLTDLFTNQFRKLTKERERNPVLIPEDPPLNKYRVTIQFPGNADPVVSITEAVSREELAKAMEIFDDVGATVLSVEDLSDLPEPVSYRAKIQSIYEHEIVHEIPDELRLTYFEPEQGLTCAKLSAGVSEKMVAEKYDEICSEREHTHAEFEKLSPTGSTFSIYQLKKDAPRELFFEGYESIVHDGHTVSLENYDKIYTAPFETGETATTLDGIYQQFNTDRPADFTGHSLSVSDLVVIDYPGSLTVHYVDRFGFTSLPDLQNQLLERKRAENRREEAVLDTVRYDGEIDLDKEPSRKPLADRLLAAQEMAAQRNAVRSEDPTPTIPVQQDEREQNERC